MSESSPGTRRAVIIASAITAFLSPFMISGTNIILPAIQNAFPSGAVLLSRVSSIYLLATAVLLVPAGKLADIYGQKKCFAFGILIFTGATIGAGCSVSMTMLLVMRAIQGAGGAFMVTNGTAILTSVFPPSERGRAIGINTAAVYIGASAGPFIGGVLSSIAGWRSIFFANALVGILSFLLVARLEGEWKGTPDDRLDILGSFLYGAALLCLMTGAPILAEVRGAIFCVVGVLLLGLFARRQLRLEQPVFDVRLFVGNRIFAFSSLAALINYSATFSVAFLLSLYLQTIRAMTPQGAGLLLVIQPALQAIISPIAGRLSDRVEPRVPATLGMGLTAIGLFMLASLDVASPNVVVAFALLLLGAGFGLFSSPNMSAIMGAVDSDRYGMASACISSMRLMGQMLSMAVVALAFTVFLGTAAVSAETSAPFMSALRLSYAIAGIFCVSGIWFSFARGQVRR